MSARGWCESETSNQISTDSVVTERNAEIQDATPSSPSPTSVSALRESCAWITSLPASTPPDRFSGGCTGFPGINPASHAPTGCGGLERFGVAACAVLGWRNQPFWHGGLERITQLPSHDTLPVVVFIEIISKLAHIRCLLCCL